ncbi:angiopoietin-2 [Aedes albopictus]|uniref:Fibrinogen C-terminal domain-containing protein n=1 Tax=Aedes albopictus TaxID=7160 RepID=A0ABM1ZWL6_AEDAL
MERRFVVLIFALVVYGSKLIQSGKVPTDYGDEDEGVATTEVNQNSRLVGRKTATCEDNREVLSKLNHLERKLQQMDKMIKKIGEATPSSGASCNGPSIDMLSSRVVYLESKVLQQEKDLKQVTDTRALRSIKTDDAEHETILSKIDILGNMISQQSGDVKQTVEVILESKFKMLEDKVKKTLEEAAPGPATNESAENTELLLTKVNLLQEKISLLENNTNGTAESGNKSPADSFGFEILRLKIDFQEVKLLQLTNEITSKNEKILKSLAHLEQLHETISEVLSKVDLNVEQSVSNMLNQSLETLQQHEIVSNETFKQLLLELSNLKKLNDEAEKKTDHVTQKLDSLETLNLKVPALFIELKQLIAQNLSQIISYSTELSQQDNRCVNNSTLKQALFDLVILKNSARYFQVATLHQSCKDKKLKTSSGKHLLHPNLQEEPFEGYCEQDKFNGGWLVIQYRFNGSVDFYRGWKDYRNGFGTIGGEFWLGLETVHRLTKDKNFTLVIEMEDFKGGYAYAKYDRFEIGGEDEWYSLKRLGSYSGTAGDGLEYSVGMNFTTWDSDNDQSSENCAVQRYGAWWYKSCTFSNLNGKYQNMAHHQSLCWYYHKNSDDGLKVSRMMIREV